MFVLKIFWRIVAWTVGVIGLGGVPEDVENWGIFISYIAPYVDTLPVRILSTILLGLLIANIVINAHKRKEKRNVMAIIPLGNEDDEKIKAGQTKEKLKAFYVQGEEYIRAKISNDQEFKSYETRMFEWSNSVSQWITEHLGEAASSQFRDTNNIMRFTHNNDYNNKHMGYINFVSRLRDNLGRLIESRVWDSDENEPPDDIATSKQSPSDHWRSVDEYKLWQVACLWVGLEPEAQIPDGHPAYPILQMLKADVTNYRLLAAEDIAGKRIHIHAEGERKDNVNMETLVKRGTLLDYIRKHKNSPTWDFRVEDDAQEKSDDPKFLGHPTSGLSSAILKAVMSSAWGKWHRNQYEGTEKQKIQFAASAAAQIVHDAARNGDIEIRGNISGTVEYEVIPQDTWIQIGFAVKFETEPQAANPLKIEPTIGIPPDPKREPILEKLQEYAGLEVDSRQFEAVFNDLAPKD